MTKKERLDRAVKIVSASIGDLPREQRSYARLAISLVEGEVAGEPTEIRDAIHWLLQLPRRGGRTTDTETGAVDSGEDR